MTAEQNHTPADLTARGLPESTAEQWREHFLRGGVHIALVDHRALRERLAGNSTSIALASLASAVAVTLIIALALTGTGRLLTFALIGLFVLVSEILSVKFCLTRRRLQAAAASDGHYLEVTSAGLRFLGIDIPWTRVTAGVGIDGRDQVRGLYTRAINALTRKAGIAEAEFTLGIRDVRALADESPQSARPMFELISDHGGIRIPLDSILIPEDVRPTMAAIVTSGTLAGVDVTVPTSASEVFTKTVAVLGAQQ